VAGAIKAGQVRPLAVASTKRLAALPNVPTAAELGVKGYESAAWFAFMGPKGLPKPIVERLNKEIAAAMQDPAVRQRFNDLGAEPLASSPEELGRFISAEVAKWRGIIQKGGITIDQN
jgi:tripartite-type tricarboxylate transporter receptor subunit TctC